MDSLRTSSLFHYTDFNGLKRILAGGLVPNYCSEDLTVGQEEFVIGLPMVCFCDIPLTRTEEFTKRYGRHAIALSKEWAARKGINPILYAVDEEIIISLRFYRSYEQMLRQQVVQAGGNPHSLSVNLNDPQSVNNIVPFINHNNAYAANRKLFGYLKRYESEWQGKPLVNYVENEWRFVVGESEQTPWFWNREDYMTWRGDVNGPKPTPGEALQTHRLTFEPADITHIILEKEDQVARMIDFIDSSRFTRVGGSADVTAADKKVLISRIISLERVAKDF